MCSDFNCKRIRSLTITIEYVYNDFLEQQWSSLNDVESFEKRKIIDRHLTLLLLANNTGYRWLNMIFILLSTA